jgi:hypothetical protein
VNTFHLVCHQAICHVVLHQIAPYHLAHPVLLFHHQNLALALLEAFSVQVLAVLPEVPVKEAVHRAKFLKVVLQAVCPKAFLQRVLTLALILHHLRVHAAQVAFIKQVLVVFQAAAALYLLHQV